MSNASYVASHLNGPSVTGWTLRIGLHRASNVRAADLMGKSDPYAVVFVNGIRRRKSAVIKRTLNPHWNAIIDVVLDRDELGANSIQSSSMTVALYDMDRVGTHDFLGAVELVGDELMNFVAQPLDHLPKWEITGTSRIKEFPLTNVEPHPTVKDLRGKIAFWGELRLNEESARIMAAIKIQSLQRGKKDRTKASTHNSARSIQRIRRAQNGRRKYEKTEFAYMAFSIACSHLKRWINWNDLTLEEVFSELDYDASGELTTTEITNFFNTHPSVELSPKDVEAIIYHMDPSGDGVVSHQEFIETIKNSADVTDKIKLKWKNHLKRRAIDMRVREMGNAWKNATKNNKNGANKVSVSDTLRAGRRRRDSRWSAEFELMKVKAEKLVKNHEFATMKASERRAALHKGWRRESNRRIKKANERRQYLQLRLMTEHSKYLQSDDGGVESGETFGLGIEEDNDVWDNTSDLNFNKPTENPVRPPGNKDDGPASTSPNAAKRSIYKRIPRPVSPTEVLSAYNFWERQLDKKTNRVFYCNCNTREVQWTLPKDGQIWPPPPPVEKEEEPRISPFADFKSTATTPRPNAGAYLNIPGRGFNDFSSNNPELSELFFAEPSSPKELDRLASRMENFGSLHWDDLKIPDDDNDDYYDDDYYEDNYYNGNKYQDNGNDTGFDDYRGNQHRMTVEAHRKHTLDRVADRHTSKAVVEKRHQHLQEKIAKRHQNHMNKVGSEARGARGAKSNTGDGEHSVLWTQEQAAIRIEAVERGRRDREIVKKMKAEKEKQLKIAAKTASKRSVTNKSNFDAGKSKMKMFPEKNAEETIANMSDKLPAAAYESNANRERKVTPKRATKKSTAPKPKIVPRFGSTAPTKEEMVNKKAALKRDANKPPKPHPSLFNLHPTLEDLRPYLVMIKGELNREVHHTEPNKEEFAAMKEQFMELVELIPDEQTLVSLEIYDDCKKISQESTNKKIRTYAVAVIEHFDEMFPSLAEIRANLTLNLHPINEPLRPYLVMLQKELMREANDTIPTKQELADMKRKFMELVELVHDEQTLNTLNIYDDCKKIAAGSTNKKIKKYASAVVVHWQETFQL